MGVENAKKSPLPPDTSTGQLYPRLDLNMTYHSGRNCNHFDFESISLVDQC